MQIAPVKLMQASNSRMRTCVSHTIAHIRLTADMLIFSDLAFYGIWMFMPSGLCGAASVSNTWSGHHGAAIRRRLPAVHQRGGHQLAGHHGHNGRVRHRPHSAPQGSSEGTHRRADLSMATLDGFRHRVSSDATHCCVRQLCVTRASAHASQALQLMARASCFRLIQLGGGGQQPLAERLIGLLIRLDSRLLLKLC